MSGFDPNEDSLILSQDAAYVATFMEITDEEWPPGTTCVLSFPTLTGVGPYYAEINPLGTIVDGGVTYKGGIASFLVPKTDTGASTIARNVPYRIHLTKEDVPYLWYRGKVERQD